MVKITTAAVLGRAVRALRGESATTTAQTRTSWIGAWAAVGHPDRRGPGLDPLGRCDQGGIRRDGLADEQQLLSSWNTGTMAQRLEVGCLGCRSHPARSSWPAGSPSRSWPDPPSGSPSRKRQLRFWAWIALTVVGPILVFFNLYVVHDYYAIAVSRRRWRRWSAWASPGLPLRAGLAAGRPLAGAAIAWAAVWFVQVPYWTPDVRPDADPEGVLPLAAQIERETTPDQLVAIIGRDWTPEVLYYAHRWGWMLNGHDAGRRDRRVARRAGLRRLSVPMGELRATTARCVATRLRWEYRCRTRPSGR